MAKTRIYELAKDLGAESKDVLARAIALGADVKTASSGVEEDVAAALRAEFSGATPAPTPAPAPAGSPAPPAGIDDAPEPETVPEPDAAPGAGPETLTDAPDDDLAIVSVPAGVTPDGLGEALGVSGAQVVAALIGLGTAIGVNDPIPADLVEAVGESFDTLVEVEGGPQAAVADPAPAPAVVPRPRPTGGPDGVKRPPVITVMGHVDHGKTTLLDAIRSTNVAAGEHGGITQHIGAYQVEIGGDLLTFLDTPGHEAFTALRARGADVTDIVVLVVAADDGIMPQTAEAISHAKAAGVPIIVAINKMDVPGADPHSVRAKLTEHEVIVEDLGGDVPSVMVSALKREGVDQLLEIIDLVAELEELTGQPKGPAKGVVIESRLDVGLGPVATVIVQEGTLSQGDAVLSGAISGRVRAMRDHTGKVVKSAGPSTPVLVQGWGEVPTAGDSFEVTKNERDARKAAQFEFERLRDEGQVIPSARERLAQLLENLRTADEAELTLIVKADAHGSLEAIRESIAKISREGGKITIAHGAVGGINENDVSLAEVTGAVVIGFNVRPDAGARRAAEDKGVEVRTYSIIYELLDEIELLLVGRLAPDEVESVLGAAEVREVFKTPRAGNIAGCYVTEGTIQRGAKARLVRDGVVVHDGTVGSLRRFKDDVREVAGGYECGIGFANFNDVKVGDVIEAYVVREVART